MKAKRLRALLVAGFLSLASAVTLTSCSGGGGGGGAGNDSGGNSGSDTQVVSGFAPRSLTGSSLYWYNEIGNKYDASFTTETNGYTSFIWNGHLVADGDKKHYTYVRDGANEAHLNLTFTSGYGAYTIEFELILVFISKTRAEATIRGVDRKTDGYYNQYTYNATVIFDQAPKDY